jgi:hypothetical protein
MRLASFLALCLLATSCTDDGVPQNGSGLDPGVMPDALVIEPDPMTNCPGSQPKVGENCGPDISESTRCEFTVGECTTSSGSVLTESVTFCCALGVWETCGGRSPCDTPAVDASEGIPADAGAPADAMPDLAPDAVTD